MLQDGYVGVFPKREKFLIAALALLTFPDNAEQLDGQLDCEVNRNFDALAALLCRHAGVGVEEKVAGADGVGGGADVVAGEMHDLVGGVGGMVFGPVGEGLVT